MKKFIGKYEDLKEMKSSPNDEKSRYICPYCDTIHGKEPDLSGSVLFDQRTMSGYCFRCETLITHDGLKNLDYIRSLLLKEESQKQDKLMKIDWLVPVSQNEIVQSYMHNRGISDSTLETFDVKACAEPPGVVFINKVIKEKYTDFLQARFIDNSDFKHVFLKNLSKKLCWLDKVQNSSIIICEGFTDGLSAYQLTSGVGNPHYPVILGGKNITDLQMIELKEFCSGFKSIDIVVCMDGGFFEDTLKIANKVYQNCYNSVVKVMPMPFNKDLNEISEGEFSDQWDRCLLFEPSKLQYIRNSIYGKR